MSRSIQEELLAVLYVIATLLAYGVGLHWLAWILGAKAILDASIAARFAWRDVRDGA